MGKDVEYWLRKHPIADEVKRVIFSYPEDLRSGVLQLRHLILDVADRTSGIGPITETLKWGQPSYLTSDTKSGTTIRLGLPKQGGFAIYVHCQTTIISEFRDMFPDKFTYEGNRAIHFQSSDEIDYTTLEIFIKRALTYHQKG